MPPGVLPRDHDGSRGELEVVPGGNPPGDIVHRDRGSLGGRAAVNDDAEDGVLPQRRLPPAGIVHEIGLQAAAHAGGGTA